MADVVVVKLDDTAMAYFVSWEGPIGRDLQRRLRTLEYRAKASAPKRTGLLASKIETVHQNTFRGGLEGRVGTEPRDFARRGYAMPVHEGARPHTITPRKPGGSLRFVVAGKVVFAKRVHHPGNRPHPYLTMWLAEAVR